MVIGEHKNWRELCHAALEARDPNELLEIVQELNRALKHEEQVRRISERLERRPVLSVKYIVDNYPRTTRTNRYFIRGVAETKIYRAIRATGDTPKQVVSRVREHQHLRLSTPPPKYFFPILPVFSKLERRSCPWAWHPGCAPIVGIGRWAQEH
jgi:hypothetical protein